MFIKPFSAKKAAEAIGPYSPAVKLGDFVYLSGQLPIDANGEIVGDSVAKQTAQVCENMMALLAAQNLELRHVVKTTVFITDLSKFEEFNQVYATYFSEPYPARSCVQVAALPKNALVEIEALVIDTLVYEARNADNSGCEGCHSEGGCEGCH